MHGKNKLVLQVVLTVVLMSTSLIAVLVCVLYALIAMVTPGSCPEPPVNCDGLTGGQALARSMGGLALAATSAASLFLVWRRRPPG